jgi:3-deoxy-manno-octulosonate cytidylyltransferase (CMP-KDO synthetase)
VEIADVVSNAGFRTALTSDTHQTGTERVAEVAARAAFADFDLIVNVQGDEPFVPRGAVTGALTRVRNGDDVGSAAAPMTPGDAEDTARVKVICDVNGRAMYFSRAKIPYVRDAADRAAAKYWQHVGVYAYRRAALMRWAGLAPTSLELAERLEQLRALQQGISFGIAFLATSVLPGIDTPEDLARAETHWQDTQGVPT